MVPVPTPRSDARGFLSYGFLRRSMDQACGETRPESRFPPTATVRGTRPGEDRSDPEQPYSSLPVPLRYRIPSFDPLRHRPRASRRRFSRDRARLDRFSNETHPSTPFPAPGAPVRSLPRRGSGLRGEGEPETKVPPLCHHVGEVSLDPLLGRRRRGRGPATTADPRRSTRKRGGTSGSERLRSTYPSHARWACTWRVRVEATRGSLLFARRFRSGRRDKLSQEIGMPRGPAPPHGRKRPMALPAERERKTNATLGAMVHRGSGRRQGARSRIHLPLPSISKCRASHRSLDFLSCDGFGWDISAFGNGRTSGT